MYHKYVISTMCSLTRFMYLNNCVGSWWDACPRITSIVRSFVDVTWNIVPCEQGPGVPAVSQGQRTKDHRSLKTKKKALKTCYPEWKLVFQPSFLKSAVISFCQLHSPSDTVKSRCPFGRFSKHKVVRFNPRKCLRHKEAKLKTSCLKLWTETTVAAMCPREATSILDKMQHHAAAFCLNSKKNPTYSTLTCLWFWNPFIFAFWGTWGMFQRSVGIFLDQIS